MIRAAENHDRFSGVLIYLGTRLEIKINGGYNRKLRQFNVAGSTLDLHRDSLLKIIKEN